jgi:hypothetical protein
MTPLTSILEQFFLVDQSENYCFNSVDVDLGKWLCFIGEDLDSSSLLNRCKNIYIYCIIKTASVV